MSFINACTGFMYVGIEIIEMALQIPEICCQFAVCTYIPR